MSDTKLDRPLHSSDPHPSLPRTELSEAAKLILRRESSLASTMAAGLHEVPSQMVLKDTLRDFALRALFRGTLIRPTN
jgi:hypothetical protein